ncbi:YqcI/YcgG family protein [Alkalihalobacillus hwajinpoensis]|uniref:YqcI/YcgG family protein n=1 Tax=Guptibacillus hwajinpoensis TaxID=208199 RepID=UPI001883EF7D|nr:YqcI/YcgG family protein [Pseudalkalibacillus hwajinpoensis]MBF0707587.1 YqcI/YcgG family protein [Pseudalkalibacillus hwajinpoensis]
MLKTESRFLLTKEDIENRKDLPEWLLTEYKTFSELVTDPTFPCFFGRTAQLKGELRYSYIEHDDWANLPDAVESFLSLFREPTKIRHGLFIFVEPEREEKSIDYYRSYFWDILQYLHNQDRIPWPSEAPKDPEHFLWDFHFAGEPIFTFGNAPAYKQRKTRNLGNSLILGFQPRTIFQGLEGTEKGGIMSRDKVRARVEKWDNLPKHPDISHFGDPNHNEWKQSFIGDDIEPIVGKCPFLHKNS